MINKNITLEGRARVNISSNELMFTSLYGAIIERGELVYGSSENFWSHKPEDNFLMVEYHEEDKTIHAETWMVNELGSPYFNGDLRVVALNELPFRLAKKVCRLLDVAI